MFHMIVSPEKISTVPDTYKCSIGYGPTPPMETKLEWRYSSTEKVLLGVYVLAGVFYMQWHRIQAARAVPAARP